MLKVAGGGTGGGSTPGAVVYQGVWNASTNVPTLTSSVGTNGYYYVVSVAGSTNLNGITDWQVSDWAVFNGTAWQKIDNTDGVVSVNGQNGVVVLTSNDVGATANTTYVLAGTGLSGGGRLNANVTVNLANTAVTAGTYGDGTHVAQIAIDAQGRITSASNVSITTAGIGTVTSVATGTGLTGGPITTTGTISIASTAVTAGVYGNAATVGTFTVNGQGQLTAAANAAISIPASAINTTIPNSGLTNSSVTINGTSISLGGSGTITSSTVGTLTLGTGLTGTSFNGSTAVTTNLANTAVVAGSYGNASTVGTFTVDAQGRLTAASNTAISIAVGSVSGAVPNTRLISTGTGLTGGGDLTADRTLSVTANSTQQLVGVQNNGTLAATRQIINFAPGNNAVIAVSDDSANGRANVTVGTSQAVTFTTSVTTPTVLMNGATSGTVTVKVPAVAGTTNFQLPASNGTSGYVLSTDGSGNTSWVAQSGGGGGGLTWQSVQTANFTASASNAYPVNTTSGAITVTLPASPTAGQTVQITDYAGTFLTNNCTIGRNGSNINGIGANISLAAARESVIFVYIDATQGWITSVVSVTNLTAAPYSASYLIIAGGGGGGGHATSDKGGGGGGAGGLLSGTATLTPGTTYTVTVGSGGAGGVGSSGNQGGTQGTNGNSSSFSAYGTAAVGGGGGGSGYGGGPWNGNAGGSGGGSVATASGTGTGGSATSGQGYAGGTASPANNSSGGGGSGGLGGNSNGSVGGNGGIGTSSSVTGSAVTYASGGGGGAYAGTSGTASAGGGGNAAAQGSSSNGVSGTAYTGGGGGGAGGGGATATNGGAGGSGAVIISVPTASYSANYTGTVSVTTSGSNTIMTFTASGSYTA